MNLLCIDTATPSCSVAVVCGERIAAEITTAGGETHSRHLLEMVAQVVGVSLGHLERVDGLVVCQGPGSFTGLRIGMGTAKGLALGLAKPLVGVSSLEVLAYQCTASPLLLVPLIDARRREVYTARYRVVDGRLQVVAPERVAAPEDAVADVAEACLLVGDGALAYTDRLLAAAGPHGRLAPPGSHHIRASCLGLLARRRITAADPREATRLAPRYLRASDARPPAKAGID
jgi:tRNA threonylcarbamoyladenosine biosynthesis protein TsaB